MENAAKALLIAGGILIAIIIIAMFVMMFGRISNIQAQQEEEIKTQQLTAFNREFEAYNKSVMYGVDVITLINKVAENNKKYAGNADYQIIITLNGAEMTSSSSLVETDQEKYVYKCSQIIYNSFGRVSKIEIINH